MTDSTTTRWEQFNEAGRLCFLQGDLARAEEAFVAAIAEAEALGSDNVRLASSLSNLGQLKYQQRDLGQAERFFRRSLEIRERSLGPDHASVAQNLNNLAALHVARNEHAEAEALLVRALQINERERGASHPDVAVTINNLAKLYFKRGDYARAEPLLLRLLALKQTPDKHNPEAAAVLASLATLRHATGHPAAAETLWKETLAVRERTLSATDIALAPALEGLADSCEAQRRSAEAITHRERALAIRLQVMGADHPTVGTARARIEDLRKRLVENTPAVAAPEPAPRLSALQMSALDVEKALQEATRADAARQSADSPPPANPWAQSEPPDSLISDAFRPGGSGGAAVATPPRRGPTPASSPTISPVRAPSPRSNTALPLSPGQGLFEVAASAPASIGADAAIWWDPSSEPKQSPDHAPNASIQAPARRSDPARRSVDDVEAEDAALHVRPTHRTERAPTSRRIGMVAGIAAGLVLMFGVAAWALVGRERSAPPSPVENLAAGVAREEPPAPEPLGSGPPASSAGEIGVTAAGAALVERPAPVPSAPSEPARASSGSAIVAGQRASASVASAPPGASAPSVSFAAAPAPDKTTIDATMLSGTVDLEKITRAIDDSTRKKVEAVTKKIEVKPLTFKEP